MDNVEWIQKTIKQLKDDLMGNFERIQIKQVIAVLESEYKPIKEFTKEIKALLIKINQLDKLVKSLKKNEETVTVEELKETVKCIGLLAGEISKISNNMMR